MLLLVLALCAIPTSVTAQKFSQQAEHLRGYSGPAGLGPDYSALALEPFSRQQPSSEFRQADFVVARLFLEGA